MVQPYIFYNKNTRIIQTILRWNGDYNVWPIADSRYSVDAEPLEDRILDVGDVVPDA